MSEKRSPKKAAPVDWHSADIVAALRKAGWSLRKLAAHHNYKAPTTLCKAIERPWPKGERLIAEAIGVHPATIWPSRYQAKDSTQDNKEKTNKKAA
jgi:Ner family transcriptional regulator